MYGKLAFVFKCHNCGRISNAKTRHRGMSLEQYMDVIDFVIGMNCRSCHKDTIRLQGLYVDDK